jgi:phosphomannomutase/phosphoglucomutase
MKKPKLFGTNGIRGDAQKLFTDEFCFDIGVSFGKFLLKENKKGEVAVGMDPRESSERIKSSLLQGFSTTASWKFLDEGIIPTPCLNYFLKKKGLAGGIMISGSHIKKELNGIKFFVNEEEITKVHEKEIERIYYQSKEEQQYLPQKINLKKEQEAWKTYFNLLFNLAKPPYPSWKIVVDAGNGTQSLIIPKLLEKLRFTVVKINCNLGKGLVVRDMEVSDSFGEMAQIVKNEKATFGIALDSDGDRAAFFDEEGRSIPGEYSCSLIAQDSPTKIIVTPINSSSVVEHIGKKVIRTKVGVLYVVQAMKKFGAQYGFEANGGGISAEIFYGRDGGTTLIKMLNLLKRKNKALSKLFNNLPQFSIIKKKVDCPRKLNKIILKKAEESFKGIRIEKIDGLKIWVDKNSWILFRPSGNAPEFRVFSEAKTEKEARNLGNRGLKLVKRIIDKNG